MSRMLKVHTGRKPRKGEQPSLTAFETLTVEEAKGLAQGRHVQFVDRHGDVRTAKITSVKTWKTRPADCDVHLKYGMYEFFVVEYRGGRDPYDQLVREA